MTFFDFISEHPFIALIAWGLMYIFLIDLSTAWRNR